MRTILAGRAKTSSPTGAELARLINPKQTAVIRWAPCVGCCFFDNLLATTLVGAAIAGFVASTVAQDWTRFRGPNGTGHSQVKTIPTKITEANILWKNELPRTGHSSPV